MPAHFTRKDDRGGTTLGVTSWGIVFIAVMLAVYFILSKSGEAPKSELTVSRPASNGKASTTVTREALTSMKVIRVAPGLTSSDAQQSEAPAATGPQQGLLENKGLNLIDLDEASMRETSEPVENFQKLIDSGKGSLLKEVMADDGKMYMKGRSGTFIPGVYPGLKLTSADGKLAYVISDKGALMLEDKDKATVLVTTPPKGMLKDITGRFYDFNNAGKLVLKTPGVASANGAPFKGPDGVSYLIFPDGKLWQVMTSTTGAEVKSVSGEGEFLGSDGDMYIAMGDQIYVKDNAATFSGEMRGAGYFRGPDAKTYLRGDDGKIYTTDSNMSVTNIAGNGKFVGPDGSIYLLDGGFVKLVKAATGLHVTEPVRTGTGVMPISNTPREEEPLQQSTGLVQTVSVDENLLHFARQGAGENAGVDLATAAKEIVGAKIYTGKPSSEVKAEAAAAALKKRESEEAKFEFIGKTTRVPFILVTKVDTSMAESLVVGMVPRPVYYHSRAIPAGTRLLGRVGSVAKNHRMDIKWTTLLFPSGEEVTIDGETFDTKNSRGLEAFYTPMPLWTYLYKFANMAVLIEINKQIDLQVSPMDQGMSDPSDQTQQTIYQSKKAQQRNVQDIVNSTLMEIQNDVLGPIAPYHSLPIGTPGYIILTGNLEIDNRKIEGVENSINKKKKVETPADVVTNAVSQIPGLPPELAQQIGEATRNNIETGKLVQDSLRGLNAMNPGTMPMVGTPGVTPSGQSIQTPAPAANTTVSNLFSPTK